MEDSCSSNIHNHSLSLEAEATCNFCGRPEAHFFASQHICDACYISKGSCCAGEE